MANLSVADHEHGGNLLFAADGGKLGGGVGEQFTQAEELAAGILPGRLGRRTRPLRSSP